MPEVTFNHPAKHKRSFRLVRDVLSIVAFILAVIAGAFLLNSFVFQSYNVYGASMQPTLETGDRLIVNKIPVTLEHIQGSEYLPQRGQVIVFENPTLDAGGDERHLVKRVIGLPGERVVVANGQLTVYNNQHPDGFHPAEVFSPGAGGPKSPTSGNIDITVPEGEIFVSGDNRIGNNSLDSRNGLGTVPLEAVEGPVYARVFPFSEFKFF